MGGVLTSYPFWLGLIAILGLSAWRTRKPASDRLAALSVGLGLVVAATFLHEQSQWRWQFWAGGLCLWLVPWVVSALAPRLHALKRVLLACASFLLLALLAEGAVAFFFADETAPPPWSGYVNVPHP